MSNQFKQVKESLLKQKEDICGRIETIEQDGVAMPMSASISELSMYDNHPADIGDELFERSKDTALIDNERTLLRDIDKALESIDNRTYGTCLQCGMEIEGDRLQALPWATTCIHCAK